MGSLTGRQLPDKPEQCAQCGKPLARGDRIVFTEHAKISVTAGGSVVGRRYWHVLCFRGTLSPSSISEWAKGAA